MSAELEALHAAAIKVADQALNPSDPPARLKDENIDVYQHRVDVWRAGLRDEIRAFRDALTAWSIQVETTSEAQATQIADHEARIAALESA